jgi:hypothetical protein
MRYNVEAMAMWRHSLNVQPGTDANYRYKSSLFILLLGVIRLPKPKLNSDVSLIVLESPRHIRQCNVSGCFVS